VTSHRRRLAARRRLRRVDVRIRCRHLRRRPDVGFAATQAEDARQPREELPLSASTKTRMRC
jgi:hypothetical protein